MYKSSILTVFALLFSQHNSLADIRGINGTNSSRIDALVRDPVRDVIYAADHANQRLVFINTLTEEVSYLDLLARPHDVAISKDYRFLALALGNAGIGLVDGDARVFVSLEETSEPVASVAFSANGQILYSVAEAGGFGQIHCYDLISHSEVDSFGLGSNLNNSVYGYSLLETDIEGNTLFVAERNQSPASLTRIDMTGPTPIFVAEDVHGTLGSFLGDFVYLHHSHRVYTACSSPYGILEIDADSIDDLSLLETGAYPVSVDASLSGSFVYGTISRSGAAHDIFQFDANSHALVNSWNVPNVPFQTYSELRPRGLAISRDGAKAFVVNGNNWVPNAYRVEVVDTGQVETNAAPEIFPVANSFSVIVGNHLYISFEPIDEDGDGLHLFSSDAPAGSLLIPWGISDAYLFSWVPTAAHIGEHFFSIRVHDGKVMTSKLVRVTVQPRQPLRSDQFIESAAPSPQ